MLVPIINSGQVKAFRKIGSRKKVRLLTWPFDKPDEQMV